MAEVNVSELLALLDRQGFRCALTGRQLTPENSVLDHVDPVAAGGSHAIENCQFVVGEINNAKGTMGQAEFVAMCYEVAAWAERQHA